MFDGFDFVYSFDVPEGISTSYKPIKPKPNAVNTHTSIAILINMYMEEEATTSKLRQEALYALTRMDDDLTSDMILDFIYKYDLRNPTDDMNVAYALNYIQCINKADYAQ